MNKATICNFMIISFGIFILSACGSKIPVREDTPFAQRGVVRDLYKFPQDLTVYAKNVKHNLISSASQKEQDAKFNKIFFGPWAKSEAAHTTKNFENTFGKANGYKSTAKWSESAWQRIVANADISRYPNTQRPAITLRQTPLRELPTMLPRFSKPTPNPNLAPFDYFQYSTLPPAMPIYIAHTSQDNLWYFIESPIAAGWVQAKDVSFVSEQFIADYSTKPMLALVKDKVQLKTTQNAILGHAYIGAIFPIIDKNTPTYTALMPIRGPKNMAQTTKITLENTVAVQKPIPLDAMSIATVGNEMMAQPYGWGGTKEYRDCSSTLHDLFTPFGIWLPRNSLAQYNAAIKLPLDNLTLKPKEQTILQKGKPFLTMVWMPGHIGLYLGEYKGRAAMFHNIWGIRVDEQGQGDDRHIIGRAVVTSLEPGKELDNIYKNQTLLTRIGGISTLPGAK